MSEWAICSAALGTRRSGAPGVCKSGRAIVSGWQRPSPIAPTTSATSRYHMNKMGDLFRALGQGEDARQAFAKALAIRERLAKAEPDRADYQRDLSVSYNKMGDLFSALGQGEDARQAFVKALAIAERLAKAEPDRADYQRDLSVSYERMGDLFSALGQGEDAREAFAKGPRHQRATGKG